MNLSRRTPLLILAVSLVLTAVSTVSVAVIFHAREQVRFQNASQAARDRVTGRLGTYLALLRSTQAFFAADPPISVDEFHAYAQRLDLPRVSPGIEGIGFAERLFPPADGVTFVPHTPGAEGLHLWPDRPDGLQTADATGASAPVSVVMLEPWTAQNQATLGFDLGGDPIRREAMARARDTGEPSMTGRLTLVQERHGAQMPGFLLFVPIYKGGATPLTVATRRDAITGFVFAPFRASELFDGLFGSEARPRVAVEVFDGAPSREHLLYDGRTQAGKARGRAPHVEHEPLTFAGREWTLRVSSLPVFASGTSPGLPWALGLGGLLVSFSLYGIALGQSRARQEAEEERRTALTLMRLGMAFASELDPQRLIQDVTDQATGLTGAAFGGYFHNDRDPHGRFSLYALSGISRNAFVGMPNLRPTPLFAPIFERKLTLRLEDVTQSEAFGKNPPYHGMPKGHPRVRSFLGVPVKGRGGRVLGALLFGHPEAARFTEKHERQLEALAAQAAVALDNASLYQEAQEAIRLRDEFLSVASHELKTPLTPLTLKLEVLQKRLRAQGTEGGPGGAAGGAEGTQHARNLETLEVAMRQVHRLGRLVTDLLDVTRITAGRMRLEPEPVDLGALAAEVIARFEPQAQRARTPLTLEPSDALVGVWDRERLDQVVAILVDNAVKYGAGKPVTVRVAAQAGDRASLSVVDRGIGIPPDALPRIFERFARAVSDRHYGGLGLGLYIARRIVEAQGGVLEVESAPGQETVFTVSLPRVPPVEARAEAEPGEGPEGGGLELGGPEEKTPGVEVQRSSLENESGSG